MEQILLVAVLFVVAVVAVVALGGYSSFLPHLDQRQAFLAVLVHLTKELTQQETKIKSPPNCFPSQRFSTAGVAVAVGENKV
jgi:Tfp pilus assembly protein PilE